MPRSTLLGSVRLFSFFSILAMLLPLYVFFYPLGRSVRRGLSWPFFRTCIALTGLRLTISGMPGGPGSLFVCNHVSYLDIPILASITDGIFVAKYEVGNWPLIGFLARIAGTIFVSRSAGKLRSERLAISKYLANGSSIFLFPEGSSSNGTGVLRFRSGLLSAVKMAPDQDVLVQPISLVYGPRDTDGSIPSQIHRDCYAWHGNMILAPHLWTAFCQREPFTVSVHFHRPLSSCVFKTTRHLAIWSEKIISAELESSFSQANIVAQIRAKAPPTQGSGEPW